MIERGNVRREVDNRRARGDNGDMSIEEHDDKMMHCRMLGHEVPFKYCRTGATGQACRKVFDCWFQTFDVEGFMKAHYTAEEIQAFLTPPKPKLMTLAELIQQAKNNAKGQT